MGLINNIFDDINRLLTHGAIWISEVNVCGKMDVIGDIRFMGQKGQFANERFVRQISLMRTIKKKQFDLIQIGSQQLYIRDIIGGIDK